MAESFGVLIGLVLDFDFEKKIRTHSFSIVNGANSILPDAFIQLREVRALLVQKSAPFYVGMVARDRIRRNILISRMEDEGGQLWFTHSGEPRGGPFLWPANS